MTLALLCSVALAVSAANATHSDGEGSNQDLVSGTSLFERGRPIDAQLEVNATSGPNGEDPRGHFVVRQTVEGTPQLDFDLSGEITCVNVNGNLAGLGGVVTKSKDPNITEGRGGWISVEDRGPGAEDAAFTFIRDAPPDCPFFRSVDFQKGNFIVHDAMPSMP